MPASEKVKPMSKLPKSGELDEYARSLNNYLAKNGNNSERSPEFRWRELPSSKSSQKIDVRDKSSSKSNSNKSSSKKYCTA